jgi:hypothetical protein
LLKGSDVTEQTMHKRVPGPQMLCIREQTGADFYDDPLLIARRLRWDMLFEKIAVTWRLHALLPE